MHVTSPPTLYHFNHLSMRKLSARVLQDGLKICHLCVVYKRNGTDGLRRLLSEVSNAKVTVTKSERIIKTIAKYLIHDR